MDSQCTTSEASVPFQLPDTNKSNDVEGTGLSACDSCYLRKIKCDRRLPCGNCQDSKTSCLRQRQKHKRKPRENVSSKLNETRQQMEARMAMLESTITDLMVGKKASSNIQDHSVTSSLANSNLTVGSPVIRKLPSISHLTAVGQNETRSPTSNQTSPASRVWTSYTTEESYSTPPFSAIEAQNMIQQELKQGTNLSRQKREAFHAALGSLTESLRTSYRESSNSFNESSDYYLRNDSKATPLYPDIEVIQWVLTPKPFDENNLWTLPDGIPIMSRDTISVMALEMQDPIKRERNPAAVVCICSLAAHYLLEQLMSGNVGSLLVDVIRSKITAYLATAQRALDRISPLAPPSLSHLQALILGTFSAQEAGHSMDAWKLISAACNVCVALNLHKKDNSFSNASKEVKSEAQWCIFICFLIDKGLAINLGKPPSLSEAYVEFDLRDFRPPTEFHCRDAFQAFTLELGFIQSSIVDLQYRQKKMTKQQLQQEVLIILNKFDVAWDIIDGLPKRFPDALSKEGMEYEVLLSKFSYFSIKTVLFHSCGGSMNNSTYHEAQLDAARSCLKLMKRMREIQAQFNIYKAHSFAHWTVLYYPFTSFFVLFCNVISKKFLPDYELMLAFVEYLTTVKSTSTPVSKLYNLCLPFCALASTALKSTDDKKHDAGPGLQKSTKRQKISHASGSLPQPSPSTGQSHNQVTQIEQQMLPQQVIIPPAGYLGNDATFELNDDVLAQFMDFQPRLQWLDTDFTAFEQTWSNTGFGLTHDVMPYSGFGGANDSMS